MDRTAAGGAGGGLMALEMLRLGRYWAGEEGEEEVCVNVSNERGEETSVVA